jgi:hypothetical protein
MKLSCNKDLKLSYEWWDLVHEKQLGLRLGSRKPS